MTLGVGRGMDLNFATMATLLAAARDSDGFSVPSLVSRTGLHENKVKGHQSWARATGLVRSGGTQLTQLAAHLLAHDPGLIQTLSRGVCYVEIVSNPDAEVAHHVSNVLLPRSGSAAVLTTDQVVDALVSDGVGTQSGARDQPRRDADLFMRSLRSAHGFGALGLLHETSRGRYQLGPIQVGPEITGYALLRRWPADQPYVRTPDAQRLLAPLLLSESRFAEDLATLERQEFVVRVTSSGLDQIRPATGRRAEEALWRVS